MSPRPRSRDEVLEMARRTAAADGWDLNEFEEPSLRKVEGGWTAFFDGKHPAPVGKYFTVMVDEPTGATRIVPGR